jgi:2-polyprenyl-3-methyl-5-hydroxy-6-metoxy-1,4-benzoquinol methylase
MVDERHVHELEHGRYLAASTAEEVWGWGTPAGQRRAKRRAGLILQGAEVGPSSRVLEIGCGTGLFTEMFTAAGGHITAIDISPDLLALARERRLPSVEFLEKSFETWEAGEQFDAVIGSSVLHHLDMQLALPKIVQLLKPGGRISFAEPNMLNPQIYCERHFRRFFPQVSPDETAFVRTRLGKTLERAGLQSVSIQPFDWLHPATPPFLIGAVSTIGRVCETVWPVKEFAGSLHIRAARPV